MVDLSQMGVLLTANLRVEPGSVLHLRVVGADESVELEVECRWTRASEHLGAFDLGMEFLRPDPDAIRRLFAIHDQAPALAAS